LWVLLEVLFLQTALASAREDEYRAAAISWIAVAVLAAAASGLVPPGPVETRAA
jgi:hypothetical protein